MAENNVGIILVIIFVFLILCCSCSSSSLLLFSKGQGQGQQTAPSAVITPPGSEVPTPPISTPESSSGSSPPATPSPAPDFQTTYPSSPETPATSGTTTPTTTGGSSTALSGSPSKPCAYQLYGGKDSPGGDMAGASFPSLKYFQLFGKCDSTPGCVGFNTAGQLKSSLVPENQFTALSSGGSDPNAGLYKKIVSSC